MKLPAFALAVALVALPANARQGPRPAGDEPARLVALGQSLERQGQLGAAMAQYRRALQLDPASPSALRAAAANAVARGAGQEAARYYAAWSAADPRNPDALIGLAGALVFDRKPDEALALLQRADDLGGNPGRAAAMRGIALDMQGNLGAAQRAYAVALDANPNDGATTQRLALSLALGRQQGAALTLMRRFGAEPESAEVRRTLALIHALGGRQDEAAQIAASLFPLAEAEKMRGFYAQLPRLELPERAAAAHAAMLPTGAASPPATEGRATANGAEAPSAIVAGPILTPAVRTEAPSAPAGAGPKTWVQLSSLSDASKLADEWRRLQGLAGDAFAGLSPYVQRAGAANRLLVGPFASEVATRQVIARLKSRRIDSFVNRTAAGADLVPLDP